ncbi:MAG: exodeoxyribonuclease VII large subunit [Bacteroidales bacterium]|nr:exodeoxyribonuclease VII large subunit [Bacteroidales bacterium]
MAPETEYIELYELQRLLKQGVARLFPDALWVKAEIASIGVRSNGHCYLELSQSDETGVIAKVRAVIWRSSWPSISQLFREVTAQELKAGQEVLVRVRPSYHELYGMSLTIDRINPQFTVGVRAVQRKQTLLRLEKEGLLTRQQKRSLPLLPYYLAVVSAPDAAGLGDFRRHLLENEYGYAYRLDLFEATMQGQTAPASICEALEAIAAATVPYDAVLILRGGGSDLDLDCYDDYDLAVAIATFPAPVLTAIGHDRDHHVADEVAYRSVKTPTALADVFLDCSAAEDERIGMLEARLQRGALGQVARLEARTEQLAVRIGQGATRRLEAESHRLDLSASRMVQGIGTRLSRAEDRLTALRDRIGIGAKTRQERAEDGLDAFSGRIFQVARGRLALAVSRLDNQGEYIRKIAQNTLERAEIKLSAMEMHIRSADPRRVLDRGIPVVENARGEKDRLAADFRPGDPLKVYLRDGKLDCVVQQVTVTQPLENQKTA